MWSEYRGNPILANLGIYGPNMEGKEVRFGAGLSALFTVITTAFTTGSVNNMHDSLTPLGGLGPMVNDAKCCIWWRRRRTHEFIDICLTDGVYMQFDGW